MENQREHREHGKKDVAEKTSKEIIVNSLAELFADDEFGFDMFIMMKTRNPPIKHFTFYEGLPAGKTILSIKSKTPSSRVSGNCILMMRQNMQWLNKRGAIRIFFIS